MKKTNFWFTLIELLISMTIFTIITMITYLNYSVYQNIAKVKIGLKEISQSIHDAKNMAINWYDKNKINQSIWIFLDKENPNTISYYSFDYNWQILLNEENLIKQKKLQDWIFIDLWEFKESILIYFSSIYWKPEIYYIDQNKKTSIFPVKILNFFITFKNAKYYPLKRGLEYFIDTWVVDY